MQRLSLFAGLALLASCVLAVALCGAAPGDALLFAMSATPAIVDTADEALAAAALAEADQTAAQSAADSASTANNRSAKKVKARVIFAGAFGKINDLVLLDAANAKAGVAAGELDTDKAAVAYAESLAAQA